MLPWRLLVLSQLFLDADCLTVPATSGLRVCGIASGITHRIILETDSTNTVKVLQSNELDLSPTSVLYKEARELLICINLHILISASLTYS